MSPKSSRAVRSGRHFERRHLRHSAFDFRADLSSHRCIRAEDLHTPGAIPVVNMSCILTGMVTRSIRRQLECLVHFVPVIRRARCLRHWFWVSAQWCSIMKSGAVSRGFGRRPPCPSHFDFRDADDLSSLHEPRCFRTEIPGSGRMKTSAPHERRHETPFRVLKNRNVRRAPDPAASTSHFKRNAHCTLEINPINSPADGVCSSNESCRCAA